MAQKLYEAQDTEQGKAILKRKGEQSGIWTLALVGWEISWVKIPSRERRWKTKPSRI